MFEIEVGYVLPVNPLGLGTNIFRSSRSLGLSSELSHFIASFFRTAPLSVLGKSFNSAGRGAGVSPSDVVDFDSMASGEHDLQSHSPSTFTIAEPQVSQNFIGSAARRSLINLRRASSRQFIPDRHTRKVIDYDREL
jgi:hypothetical protein